MEGNSLKLREIVLNTRIPVVFRNFKTQWKCSEETLEDWCQHFDEERIKDMEFEQMPINSHTRHPQWESERKTVKMTMKEFLQKHSNQSQDFWEALNYKTPDEVPKKCKDGIDFSCFGFPHILDDYARFWLSSACANTPCHYDTYGCNIVVQIFGSKSWLLFPPNTPLTTTRLPYEESSVYCLNNFYAPASEQLKDLERFQSDAYICQLNAGDVLIVPRYWWHFVETIEISLSINSWIPLEEDAEARLQECVVKYLIETIVRQENIDARKYLLNPNQEDLSSEEDVLNILAFLSDVNPLECDDKMKKISINYSYQYLEEEKVKLILKEFPNGKFVEKANASAYKNLIERNAARFVSTSKAVEISPVNAIKMALINSICCPNTVREITHEFRTRYNKVMD